MSLRSLPALLRNEPAMARVIGASSATLAVSTPAQAFTLAGLVRLSSRRPVLVITPTGTAAEQLAHDLDVFSPEHVALFPAWETLPFERVSPEVSTMGRRLQLLWQLAGEQDQQSAGEQDQQSAGERDAQSPGVVVAPIKAVLQQLGPWRHAARPVTIARGDSLVVDDLVARLVGMGYRRESLVEHRGELAVRGGIVDVFPSTDDEPIRIDLWGDEVDRLTRFDVADQRSTVAVEHVSLFGCRELVPDEDVRRVAASLVGTAPWGRHQWEQLSDGALFDGMESWLPWLSPSEEILTDVLPSTAVVIVVEPRRVRQRAEELADEESALADALAGTWGLEAGAGAPRLHVPFDRLLAESDAAMLSLVPTAEGPEIPAIESRGWEPILGDGAKLAGQVRSLVDGGYTVALCAGSGTGADRLATILAEEGVVVPVVEGGPGAGEAGARDAGARDAGARDAGVREAGVREAGVREAGAGVNGARGADGAGTKQAPPKPGAQIVVASVDRGFIVPASKVAVLAESDVTGRHRPHRQARTRARPVDGFFDDLAPGNYVVHRQHGVARYGGMVTRTMGGSTRDYLLLEYRGGDKLYLPTDQIELLTPYAGGDSPTVNRLGGSEWQRARSKARAAVHEIAEELVALYRRRLEVEGRAFGPDTPWQAELESSFPFVETTDQLRAIEDVKADMERPLPMDRLVCGDVGFGKTEVAIRAVFKAVQEGTQAAVLVPTTLLASQHFQTFTERYAPFPVRVELLSRFLTNAQAKRVIDGLADGSVDVVIGTHRLLAADIAFKKLGLLVVDEEQRFGVSHKETIKAMSDGVDVLTLTASPIPRTLEMALTGIRDLSMVNTPPAERRPILTHVGEFESAAASEAIRRELLREGQVFYVHNRVQSIDAVAEQVRRLAPEARVAVAHGQMDEGTLEQVVMEFWEGKYDVLVCTTIIESGIDMPSVNTLVVDRADRLGLGQLHQLRGRVGRSGQRAYAYLFHPADRVLTEQAYERLRTIGDHTELGSGFKIALRDLQIRGAGNLLGRDQSGHIAAVGYDLYVQMVSEAVAELKGEARPAPVDLSIDLPDAAHLPPTYVEAEDVRLEAYRRLTAVRTVAEVEDVRSEWEDRFGPLPPAAVALLDVALLRVECIRLGITDVAVTAPRGGSGIGGGGVGGGGAGVGASAGVRATAKLSPVSLPASAEIRLRRLAPGGSWHEDLRRLLVPVVAEGPERRYAPVLVELLRSLIPPPAEEAGAVATTAKGGTAAAGDRAAGGTAGGDLRASGANR
ncbi:MAG TPA: transcription-repair coupling factor [Acidimicrobiales bacterium]|nr:transcription-repair coupling factor [Acidimicrobiales bacterium]